MIPLNESSSASATTGLAANGGSSTTNGIDVSDYQPNVNWKAVNNSGYSFAYAKATEGTHWAAHTFAPNWTGLVSAGMRRGAYHMFRFDQDPIAQAKHFLSVAKPASGDLPPALDLELAVPHGAERAVADIAAFLAAVENVTGAACVLYLGYYFWQGALGATTRFSDHPLWLAQYSGGSQPSLMPSAWSSWTLWQYTDKKPVGGVAGAVDADYFNGNSDALGALTLP
ncbi:MAG: GH25 family lysozyme [Candidatus Baltobacteraceae bacterium]